MRHKEGNTGSRPSGAEWSRRVIVGLWVLVFVAGGGVLSVSWDVLMARLARPPVGDMSAGGALR